MKIASLPSGLIRLGTIILTLSIVACSPGPAPVPVSDTGSESAGSIKSAPGTEDGQWGYLGGNAAHTRYSPADEVTLDNYEDLEEAWVWDGASFNAQSGRSTPSYINANSILRGTRRYVSL